MKYHYDTLQTENYKQLHNDYVLYLEITGYNTASCYSFGRYVKEFLYLQEQNNRYNLADITVHHIREYYRYLDQRPSSRGLGTISSSYIHAHLYAVRILFNYRQQGGYISKNPMSGLKFPTAHYNRRGTLTIEEIKHLYAVCETLRDRAMLSLFYGCGLRMMEAEQLNIQDINYGAQLLVVREGKGKKRREIPLSKHVQQDLQDYYNNERVNYIRPGQQQEQNAFMLNIKGRRMTRDSYHPRIKQLLKKTRSPSILKKNISTHNLRHSIATHLLEQGLSIEQVRDFLGHQSVSTTQVYTHINQNKPVQLKHNTYNYGNPVAVS